MQGSVILMAFLEDPGAANFLGPVLKHRMAIKGSVDLYAAGTGAVQLKEMGIAYRDAATMGNAADAMARVRPWALLVGTSETPDTAAFDLIAAARQAGIPSIGGVDSAANADFRFRGHSDDPLAHAPDFLLLTDDLARRNFTALGFPEERIVICGHPYYDEVREVGATMVLEGRDAIRRRLFPEAEARPVVIFLGEISGGLNPEQFVKSPDYTLTGRGRETGRTQIVIEEFLDAVAALDERPYLVLRPHPKNTDVELGPYYAEFDMISRNGDALEMVFAADLVVGMSTSLLVEAALLGRPAISIIPRATERDWLPITAAGIAPCLTRREDIAPALALGLKNDACDIGGFFPSGATIRAEVALKNIERKDSKF